MGNYLCCAAQLVNKGANIIRFPANSSFAYVHWLRSKPVTYPLVPRASGHGNDRQDWRVRLRIANYLLQPEETIRGNSSTHCAFPCGWTVASSDFLLRPDRPRNRREMSSAPVQYGHLYFVALSHAWMIM